MALADTVLTETIIDISDLHTVLDTAGASCGPFVSDQSYCDLHQRISAAPGRHIGYVDACGVEGTVLDQLRPGYADEKFWHYILNDSFARYPTHAWRQILPLVAFPRPRIEVVKRNWTFEIKPKTSVLLYPFGWSTRISLRIVGRHSLADLADVVDHLFNGQCIKPLGATTPLRLVEYFGRVADGVRTDAFVGAHTNDVAEQMPLMVITVLAKYGPSASAMNLTSDEQRTMLRLVRPTNRVSSKPFADHIRYLLPNDPFQYALVHEGSYFMWVQSLLNPEKRYRQLLRCHHNNTFESLERAKHLKALIANSEDSPSFGTQDVLVQSAVTELRKPKYKGKLVLDFVQTQEVKDLLTEVAG